MKDGKLHHRTRDLTGRRFGLLTVLRPGTSNGRKRRWMCRCACGSECEKVGADLTKAVKRGQSPNCGCRTRELHRAARITHGMTKHPAYAVWRSMMDRCRLPSHQAWKNYGARGIRVCSTWQSFEGFWSDMGESYEPGLTLERENNDGNYEPSNCRWATYTAQANNRRVNRRIPTPRGEMTVAQAARAFGVGRTTILYRISRGWPTDRLLEPPDFTRRVVSTTS